MVLHYKQHYLPPSNFLSGPRFRVQMNSVSQDPRRLSPYHPCEAPISGAFDLLSENHLNHQKDPLSRIIVRYTRKLQELAPSCQTDTRLGLDLNRKTQVVDRQNFYLLLIIFVIYTRESINRRKTPAFPPKVSETRESRTVPDFRKFMGAIHHNPTLSATSVFLYRSVREIHE